MVIVGKVLYIQMNEPTKNRTGMYIRKIISSQSLKKVFFFIEFQGVQDLSHINIKVCFRNDWQKSWYNNIVVDCFSNRCCYFLGTFPIDTTKTRLQIQGQKLDARHVQLKYSGMTDAFLQISRQEGVSALYSGYVNCKHCKDNSFRNHKQHNIIYFSYAQNKNSSQ